MLKALIKKELSGIFNQYFSRSSNKKGRGFGNKLLVAFLIIYLVGVFGFMFYQFMDSICLPLQQVGLSWLYFALAGLIATSLAIIGSVFMAQSMLFEAKDNETLLSLPIPPSYIVLGRMISLYLQNFLMEALVLIPTIVVYFQYNTVEALSLIIVILVLFLLPLVGLAITCLLGWLIALLMSHVSNKTPLTVATSLIFLGLYFWGYANISEYTKQLLVQGHAIGETVKRTFYPFYQMGIAIANQDILAFILFTIFTLVIGIVVYILLSNSFIKIATTRRSASRKVYKQAKLNVSNQSKALFRKELGRFLNSPVYLLNTGLGSAFLIVGAVFVVVKSDMIASIVLSTEINGDISVMIAIAVAFMASMNLVTAPSISLEGNNIWILQTMPVDAWKVLMAKLKLHMIVTLPAAEIMQLCACVVFKASIEITILSLLLPFLLILLSGNLGLYFNLKHPRLDWTNETVAVKQSSSVLLTMLAMWGLVAGFIIFIIYFGKYAGVMITGGIFIGLLILFNICLIIWLKNTGSKIFETLSA